MSEKQMLEQYDRERIQGKSDVWIAWDDEKPLPTMFKIAEEYLKQLEAKRKRKRRKKNG